MPNFGLHDCAGLGLIGAAIATSFANLLQAAVLIGIVKWWQVKRYRSDQCSNHISCLLFP